LRSPPDMVPRLMGLVDLPALRLEPPG
jgi:hypothetical protein